jgi:hypothetical protein
MHLYDAYCRDYLGAVQASDVVEVSGGQQRLTPEAGQAVRALLSSKFATLSGSMRGAAGYALEPGYAEDADAWALLFYVATPPPDDALLVELSEEHVLVDLAAASENLSGNPTDVAVVKAKDAAVAAQLSQPGASLAQLPPLPAIGPAAKSGGIRPATVIAAAAGAAVGALVGGVAGAVIGGLGAGALAQELAS